MGRIRAPNNLPELVRSTFARAKASGDVNFYPTQAAVLHVNSIPFQLRFSPSLANKPKPPKPTNPDGGGGGTKPFDPFADPPAALVVSKLEPPAHYLVLNKFAIVPEHFILATTAFAAQTDLLDAADLAAARACVDAYGEADGGLFVFFNCGEHSGASQAHRHLQLLPVARMRDGLPPDGGWEVLAARLGADPGALDQVPFPCLVERLHAARCGAEADPDGRVLREAYLALYRRACGVMGVEGVEGQMEGEARISYNLAMTRDVMVLCPRRAEGAALVAGSGDEVGKLALNGTVLAGTALVKSEAEWDALRGDPDQLGRVLARI
ncbi:hypothetical protein MCOR21_001381 [Pyricularia oryzae]|nr:hypothetical protein MCOR32_007718 [Pyricularia oryzae]KAI6396422.1 hypothetical protein MCOR23_006657 [Pyricularia oryzae]KAI6406594.1 hypothetical protein MCOR20_006108 [Pyricularia oryzae]KAI6436093.1 hypothetical protein MCOR21_001381 [Pyricularia oryzae]KAI6497697.1 hypothetical protein MCOR11_004276 [Pyricularia oryzae]